MSPDELILSIAREVAAAHRAGAIDRQRAAAIAQRPSPIALALGGLHQLGLRVDAAGGWERVYWTASPEARAAWSETLAMLLAQFPRFDDWCLVGSVDGKTKAAGRFAAIDLRDGYATGFLDAIRLGRQAEPTS